MKDTHMHTLECCHIEKHTHTYSIGPPGLGATTLSERLSLPVYGVFPLVQSPGGTMLFEVPNKQ